MIRRAFLLFLASTVIFYVTASEADTKVGQAVADFQLADCRQNMHSLSRAAEKGLVVVAFLGTECPIVKLYSQRLQELAEQYIPQGVVFLGVLSNQQDSLREIEQFAEAHKIRFPLLKDPGNRVADRFGAERTPEVFVLDSERVVRYHGRIDDRYNYEIQREKATSEYLVAALDELLAGKDVSAPETKVIGCLIGRALKSREHASVTYTDQISRILQRRCIECHRDGEIAPFALTDYDEVAGWAEMIEEVVRLERMPPWHASSDHGEFANNRVMSTEEKRLIATWVEAGAPKGDPADLPAPQEFVDGWQLPQKPELMVPMRRRPFTVPATGVIEYQYFAYDPGFDEDKWVTMAEVLPGNRKVVHHVLVFAQSPKGERISGEMGGFLAAYVPGLRAVPYPPGMAKKIEAGSRLIFQVHYTPVGTEQEDLSQLGLVFAAPEEVTHEVITSAAVGHQLNIPPHAENHRVEATSPPAPRDVSLLAMMPHMHLRGKSFRYLARYPDGSEEILLDVPRYDFNWQTAYRLARPKLLPAGTRIHCIAHFDNSKKNPANPDPTTTVSWGEQTWDEMMIGYVDIALPVKPLRK